MVGFADPAADVSYAAPLDGVLVLELGERLGAHVCGSLLAQLGAEVVLVERDFDRPGAQRAFNAFGKRSIVLESGNARDERLLSNLLRDADVVLTSSDVTPVARHEGRSTQIICDVTAFGNDGPLAGLPYPDSLVQALTGLADTTGHANGPPTLIGFPFCETAAGIYAAAAVLVAHRVRRTRGFGQSVDVALFDCAVSTLSTFLPFHFIGKPVTRSGNRHSLAAPWNAYRTTDGWVLICTANDDQWGRLTRVVGRPELANRPGFGTNAERVARRADVDAAIEEWTATRTVDECIERLSSIGIASGPIVALGQLENEPNLAHRHMLNRHVDPLSGRDFMLPGSPLALCGFGPPEPAQVPLPDADRARVQARLAERQAARSTNPAPLDDRPALEGLRVIEIGQYTTAPLVARQLGALGADVLKIEPPGGEGSRTWPPLNGRSGYFFAFSNSDKKSVVMDLREDSDRTAFRALLHDADVLVENLKPGSLARLGFAPAELLAINSRLVYCAISGFGASSAYPGRAAFDTVVQAMSGFMDLTRAGGVPVKAGISAADIMGGEIALFAILAALEARERSGAGRALDISMQDAAVWATGAAWHRDAATSAACFVRCADGYVCVVEAADTVRERLQSPLDVSDAVPQTRAAFIRIAREAGLIADAVQSVSEVAQSAHTAARKLIVSASGPDGHPCPLLASPLRLEKTPPRVQRCIGELGEANDALFGPRASS